MRTRDRLERRRARRIRRDEETPRRVSRRRSRFVEDETPRPRGYRARREEDPESRARLARWRLERVSRRKDREDELEARRRRAARRRALRRKALMEREELQPTQEYKTKSFEEIAEVQSKATPWQDDVKPGKGVDETGALLRQSARRIARRLAKNPEEYRRLRRSLYKKFSEAVTPLLEEETDYPFVGNLPETELGEEAEFAPTPDVEATEEVEDGMDAPVLVSPSARASVVAAFLDKALEVTDDNMDKVASLGRELVLSLEDHVIMAMGEFLEDIEVEAVSETNVEAEVETEAEEVVAVAEEEAEELLNKASEELETEEDETVEAEEESEEVEEEETEIITPEEIEITEEDAENIEEEVEEAEEAEEPECVCPEEGEVEPEFEIPESEEESEETEEDVSELIDEELTASEIEEVERIIAEDQIEQVIQNGFVVAEASEEKTAKKSASVSALPTKVVDSAKKSKLQVTSLEEIWK